MIKIKIVGFYLILGLLHCQSYCVSTLLSEGDSKQIKDLLHGVSQSIYSAVSDAITQQKSRSYLIANLRLDLAYFVKTSVFAKATPDMSKAGQKQNLSSNQVDTIMNGIDQVITSKYYVQVIKSYKKAIGSGKMEDAVALINQVVKATEDSIKSFVENEINKINEQGNLKLTDGERQQIEDNLMEEESEVAKDGILEKLSKDKNFSNKFTALTIQSIQENVHIHMHSHSESHTSSLSQSSLPTLQSISGQKISLDPVSQIQSSSLLEPSKSLITSSGGSEFIHPLLPEVQPVIKPMDVL